MIRRSNNHPVGKLLLCKIAAVAVGDEELNELVEKCVQCEEWGVVVSVETLAREGVVVGSFAVLVA